MILRVRPASWLPVEALTKWQKKLQAMTVTMSTRSLSESTFGAGVASPEQIFRTFRGSRIFPNPL